ncbi:MAG: cytochrome c oxidase assembly protein [Steroidobacteraceae bacterium]
MSSPAGKRHRGLAARLVLMAAGSFAFGFALVPLYDVFCEITGIGSRQQLSRAGSADGQAPDASRIVVVEFTASVPAGGWEFEPVAATMEVQPGRLYETHYRARNLADGETTGQAVPSVAPMRAARYFVKTECFCFTPQRFAGGEEREMAVRFVIDRELPPGIDRLTLSYAFYDVRQSTG